MTPSVTAVSLTVFNSSYLKLQITEDLLFFPHNSDVLSPLQPIHVILG